MKTGLSISKKVQQHLRWIKNDIAFAIGQQRLPEPKDYEFRILIYHGIDETGNLQYNSRFISKKYFIQQIRYYKEHFHLLSLQDIFEQKLQKNKLNVAITFDDGYANNLKYVLPVLEGYEVPATFFVTTIQSEGKTMLWTDFIDLVSSIYHDPIEVKGIRYIKKGKEYFSAETGNTLKIDCKLRDTDFKIAMQKAFPDLPDISTTFHEDHYRLMNPEELQKLAKSNFATIGTHGKYHNCLGLIDEKDAIAEMHDSKNYLQNLLQQEINIIAYPDGSYTRSLIDAAEQSGYKYQLAVDYLFEEDKEDNRLINRFGINPYISFNNQIFSILKGSYL